MTERKRSVLCAGLYLFTRTGSPFFTPFSSSSHTMMFRNDIWSLYISSSSSGVSLGGCNASTFHTLVRSPILIRCEKNQTGYESKGGSSHISGCSNVVVSFGPKCGTVTRRRNLSEENNMQRRICVFAVNQVLAKVSG